MNSMIEKSEAQYWFNLKTLKVEQGLLSAAPYRVGPFKTEQEARDALKLLAERSKTWLEEEDQD